MSWNQQAKRNGLTMGWHWYRDTPTGEPYPVKVFDVAGIEYAWLIGEHADQPKTVRLEQCDGEFLGQLPPPGK